MRPAVTPQTVDLGPLHAVIAAHWSTKYYGRIAAGLRELAAQGAELITTTETGDQHDRKAIKRLEGFDSYQGETVLDECAILWHRSYGTLVEGLAAPVTTQAFRRGGGQVVAVRCCTVVLHVDDGREVWSVLHTPSAARDGLRPGLLGRIVASSRRAKVHVSVLRGHAKHVKQIRTTYRARRTRVAGDFNVPLQKARYRAYVTAVYATAGLRLHLEPHPAGTHGPARYDATLIGRGWTGAWVKVLPKIPGHDHKPILEKLTARRPRPGRRPHQEAA